MAAKTGLNCIIPDNPRTFKTIKIPRRTRHVSVYFWVRSNWLLSCCDVPANVYFFWYHKGKATTKKNIYINIKNF